MDPKTIQNPLNQNHNRDVTIKVWGERLGSPYPERRKLFIEVNATLSVPMRGELDLLQYALNAIDSVLSSLAPRFPNPHPWWLFSQCKYCQRQFLNSITKNLPTNTWRTQFCIRHGILHNYALFSIDNKERVVVTMTSNDVVFTTFTNRYNVTFIINKDHAEAQIVRSDNGTVMKFIYRNHANSYPFASAYAFLFGQVRRFIGSLRDTVTGCIVRNIFINGVQVCPAASGGEVADGGGAVGEGGGV